MLHEHQRPLLIIAKDSGLDGVAAGQGLAQAISAGRAVTIVALANPPEAAAGLPTQLPSIKNFPPSRDFVISVKTDQTQIASLSYDVRPGGVDIHLIPKSGTFQVADVTMPTTPFVFDHIITIGLRHLEDLGTAFHQEREFFFQTPIINIDHHPANARFGHVNLVDLTAASLSEVATELALHLNDKLEPATAETLLTGLVSATQGFQSDRLTPRTLTLASRLMTAGARREEIIRRLYQKKTVPLLRLWGLALSRLQSADHDRLVWTTLSADDLHRYNVTPDQAAQLSDELLAAAPGAQFACLLVEAAPDVTVTIYRSPTAPNVDLPEALAVHDRHIVGRLPGTLALIEKEIVGTLRTALDG